MSLLRRVNRLHYVAFPFGNLKADVDIRSVVKMWHPDYGNVSRKYRIIQCCNPILQRSRVVLPHVEHTSRQVQASFTLRDQKCYKHIHKYINKQTNIYTALHLLVSITSNIPCTSLHGCPRNKRPCTFIYL